MNFGFFSKRSRKFLEGVLSKKVFGVGLLITLIPNLASAAAWRLTPSVDLTETYTDNVTLSDDSDSESEWISQVNPAFSLTGTGRELELVFDYRMQNIFFASDSGRNNTNHQLNANMHATLAPHWLYLDASSSLNQQVLNPDEDVSIGNLSVVSGREDVLTTSVSPYISTRLTNRVLADLRFTHDRVDYSGNDADDSSADQLSLGLQSARAFGSWTWALRHSEQDINYSGSSSSTENSEDEKLRNTVLDLGYQLNAKIRLTGQIGYDDNDYQVSAGSEAPEGQYWSLGTVWTPSTQTSLTASGGHRYFGDTWRVNLVHQGRRNNWQLGYNEDITSQRQLQLGQDGIPVGQPRLPGDISAPTDEFFLDRSADFIWSINHRKSTTTFRIDQLRREFQDSENIERTLSVDLGWDWKVSRHSDFHVNMGKQKTKRDTGNDRYKLISLNFEEQLGRYVSSSYELRNVRRDTSGVSNDYSENQISASLRMSW